MYISTLILFLIVRLPRSVTSIIFFVKRDEKSGKWAFWSRALTTFPFLAIIFIELVIVTLMVAEETGREAKKIYVGEGFDDV